MTRIPRQWPSPTCSCGSGKPKSAHYDARGIFLTYTCEDCHDRKMAGYRPDVLPYVLRRLSRHLFERGGHLLTTGSGLAKSFERQVGPALQERG